MIPFTLNWPTKVYFGQGQLSHLDEIKQFGHNVLLVYGGGSIKKTGLYDQIKAHLEGMNLIELGGVQPNPHIQSVIEGANLAKKHQVDVVLAVGGGSIIDCSKLICAATLYEGDPWDLVIHPKKITQALPLVTVLTLAATGSEMNPTAVIQNDSLKIGTRADCLYPRFSILDPSLTFTLPPKQTSAGVADMISHTLENYFTPHFGKIQKEFAEALLRTAIHYGPIALKEPTNEEARAHLMYTSTLAINGIVQKGVDIGWSIHPMEHPLSVLYGVTHGEGLAILTPVWMDYVLNEKTEADFARFGRKVFDLHEMNDEVCARTAIECLRQFFKQMNLPTCLREVGIKDDQRFRQMAEFGQKQLQRAYVPLSVEDVIEIYRRAL